MPFQNDGMAVVQDDPSPDKQDAALVEADAIVVFPNEAGSLQQEKLAPDGLP